MSLLYSVTTSMMSLGDDRVHSTAVRKIFYFHNGTNPRLNVVLNCFGAGRVA